MKHFCTLFLVLSSLLTLSQNPICPPGVYMADPSAKVFGGKIYLYTSTDESCDYWCSYHHDILSSSNMTDWTITKAAFHSTGEKDEVPYNDNLLFAPDCITANDSFYLYYCQPEKDFAEGVAVASQPEGPFKKAAAINTFQNSEIDPSCFIDDDGTAFYIWGQFSLKMAVMHPNMRELDESTLRKDILTEKEHFFHEGAFMTKHNGLYYLVYADISREDKPTCLGYATSKNPFGPYEYRGVIVDNAGCNPNNWNNHGSIAKFNDQWYVFYHRSTHGCGVLRKACVEKIHFKPDGTIPEVEMTSQGADDPLDAFQEVDAARACLLHGRCFIQHDGEGNEIVTNLHHDDKAIFKYLDFGKGAETVSIRIKTHQPITLALSADKPWHQRLCSASADTKGEWTTLTFPVEKVKGVHALYLQVWGEANNLAEVDWLRFN